MTNIVIFHNPRCTKSRQALALLEEKGYQPKVIEYLKTPPSKIELQQLLKRLAIPAHELLRKNEAIYQELALENKHSEAEIIDAMFEHPILIERPIVIVGDQAVIARPPEKLLTLL